MPTDQEIVFSTSPYPGLRSFLPNEADIFFGREEQIDELLKRLQSTRFLSVVGTSGCGKSSLVKAGMVPSLEAGFLVQAGTNWCVAEMRPGEAPFNRLATSVLASLYSVDTERLEPETVAFVQAALHRGPLGLVDVLRERGLPNRANLLLVIDQFEEIFRFHREGNADEADAFVNLLLDSSAQAEFPVYVVLTMRSDFLGECALFDGLPQAMNNNQFLTPRLSRKECEAAIVKPARVFGGQVDPLLVNHLLNDMGSDFDQLPLLQHALMRMWELATDGKDEPAFGYDEGPTLQLADYKAIGGLKDALSLHADEVYGALDPKQKNIAEIMFRRLTERGVGKRDIRRPTQLRELAEVAEAAVDDVKEIVEAFRRSDRSFLMPPPTIPLNQDTIIDIGHESLIRQWHRLNEWVTVEAESARIYQRLADDTVLYEQGKVAYLIDPELQIASDWYGSNQPNQAWANRYHSAEFSQVQSFLEASQADRERLQNVQAAREREKIETAERIARIEREKAETSEKLVDEQRSAAQTSKRNSRIITVIALFALGFAVYAFDQKKQADIQKGQADGLKIKADSTAIVANSRADSIEAQSNSIREQAYFIKKQKDTLRVTIKYLQEQQIANYNQNEQLRRKEYSLRIAIREQEEITKNLRENNLRDSLHLAGLRALEKGQLDSAKANFVILSNNTANKDNLSKWWIEYNLGSIYHKSGDFMGAQTAYYKARSYLNKDVKSTAVELAVTLYKEAQWLRDEDLAASAELNYQRALELLKRHQIKDTTEYRINIEVNLADLQRELGYRIKEAKDLYSTVLNKLKKKYGQANLRTLEVTDKLAQLYFSEQKPESYEVAKKLFKAEIEGMVDRYGPDYYGLAPVYQNLASIYDNTRSAKDTATVLRAISQAIFFKNANLKQDETTLENLQQLYINYNNDYAQKLHETELNLRRINLSAGSIQLAREIIETADFYNSPYVQKNDTAKNLYKEALKIQEQAMLNSDTKLSFTDTLRWQHTLEDLGDLFIRSSEKDSALLFYNRVDVFRRAVYGDQSPLLTNNLKKVADLLPPEQAEKTYRDIITIWQNIIGPQEKRNKVKIWNANIWQKSQSYAYQWRWFDLDCYIFSFESLGDTYVQQGKREQASIIYGKAIQILEWLGGPQARIKYPIQSKIMVFTRTSDKEYVLRPAKYQVNVPYYQIITRIKEKRGRVR